MILMVLKWLNTPSVHFIFVIHTFKVCLFDNMAYINTVNKCVYMKQMALETFLGNIWHLICGILKWNLN